MENNQIEKLETKSLIEIIENIPKISEKEKANLLIKVASDDIEIRKSALEMMKQSQIAQHDLVAIMGELSALNKQGMYVKSKQTIKTGSGNFEIEMKGGDRKIIMPVLITLGIIAITIVIIVFL